MIAALKDGRARTLKSGPVSFFICLIVDAASDVSATLASERGYGEWIADKQVFLSPTQMVTADMLPDNVGTGMYHCHVSEHMMAGMTALYQSAAVVAYRYFCVKLG